MYRKAVTIALVALVSSCGQPATTPQDAVPAAKAPSTLKEQSVVIGGVTFERSITAKRSLMYLDETTITWNLTKTAKNDGQENTAAFDVTATKTKTTARKLAGQSTVVASDPATPIKLCFTGTAGDSATLTINSLKIVGSDGGGSALGSIDLSGLITTSIADGTCVTAAYTVNSAAPATSVPPLTAADVAMLDSAATFSLVYDLKAVSSTSYNTYISTLGPVAPTTISGIGINVVGDESVTLADPTFGYSQPISDTTTKTFSKAFDCTNKTGLTPVAGSSTDYTYPNTATVKGAATNLTASATDKVTLRCALGCTYTLGYYKTHATYFGGTLNRKYDPNAWAGARDWTGSSTKLKVGGTLYTQQQIVAIYNMAPAGNQAIALFHQVATAKLNLLKTNPTTPHPHTMAALTAADAWFAANPGWLGGTWTGNPTQWISILDAFNNGCDSAHCG